MAYFFSIKNRIKNQIFNNNNINNNNNKNKNNNNALDNNYSSNFSNIKSIEDFISSLQNVISGLEINFIQKEEMIANFNRFEKEIRYYISNGQIDGFQDVIDCIFIDSLGLLEKLRSKQKRKNSKIQDNISYIIVSLFFFISGTCRSINIIRFLSILYNDKSEKANLCKEHLIEILPSLRIHELVPTLKFFNSCHREIITIGNPVNVNPSSVSSNFRSLVSVMYNNHRGLYGKENIAIVDSIVCESIELSSCICLEGAFKFYSDLYLSLPLSYQGCQLLFNTQIVFRCLMIIAKHENYMGFINSFINQYCRVYNCTWSIRNIVLKLLSFNGFISICIFAPYLYICIVPETKTLYCLSNSAISIVSYKIPETFENEPIAMFSKCGATLVIVKKTVYKLIGLMVSLVHPINDD
ncbi:hypothetical protein DICPUDRAFT_85514 [Dictyostelium purpureum]|uniref:Uncharacterized protein n=1 Tax=Dictyostelium purpureum TaxID=5786 RepID=F1A5Z3_DICPU|nr:uncharacterized protein DICPUDRAFT_85514 [Dictyostelium purpureum]EGC28388.1 hypothetical protein DICPUDRAFT_85514 [Dictyostelium purpureum]|eukprot:XP_003295087.1 hypothetical protein DICPUDRAFT_85514 [Dictyostelium purpureum]